jgi:hypothetical protein
MAEKCGETSILPIIGILLVTNDEQTKPLASFHSFFSTEAQSNEGRGCSRRFSGHPPAHFV